MLLTQLRSSAQSRAHQLNRAPISSVARSSAQPCTRRHLRYNPTHRTLAGENSISQCQPPRFVASLTSLRSENSCEEIWTRRHSLLLRTITRPSRNGRHQQRCETQPQEQIVATVRSRARHGQMMAPSRQRVLIAYFMDGHPQRILVHPRNGQLEGLCDSDTIGRRLCPKNIYVRTAIITPHVPAI